MVVNPALVGPEATTWTVTDDDWEDADSLIKSAVITEPDLLSLWFELNKRVPARFISSIVCWVLAEKKDSIKSITIDHVKIRKTEKSIRRAIESIAQLVAV